MPAVRGILSPRREPVLRALSAGPLDTRRDSIGHHATQRPRCAQHARYTLPLSILRSATVPRFTN